MAEWAYNPITGNLDRIGDSGSIGISQFDIGTVNLGITYNAVTGTFSVTSASGAPLSSNNAGYVILPSKSAPGTKIILQVTADQTFTDDNGSSTIIGNLFGLTTGIAHADPIPFFIYAVLNDTEDGISFMISRYPNTPTSPVAAKIGKTGSAVADTQGSFFALGDPTVADYEQNPCIPIGAFRMSMSASNDWTVEALSNTVGIGRNFLIQRSNFVSKGQFGAASGKWFLNNGGTAPDQTVGSFGYSYSVSAITNEIKFSLFFVNVNVAGTGSVVALLASPYVFSQIGYLGGGTFGGGTYSSIQCASSGSGTQTVQFGAVNAAASGSLVNAAFVVGANASFTGTFTPLFS